MHGEQRFQNPSPDDAQKRLKSSSERPMASGEIDPKKPEKVAKLREEIDELQAKKAEEMEKIKQIEKEMQEVLKGPRGENLHQLNLDVLNGMEEEKRGYEREYKRLGMDIARKRVELEDLSN
jgi:hypothetical protein